MISRGTTPTHSFTFPFNYNEIENITITYKQDDLIVKKGMDEISYSTEKISTTLSQEESMMFTVSNKPVEIQVKVKNKSGVVSVSNVILVSVGKLLDEEVMLINTLKIVKFG